MGIIFRKPEEFFALGLGKTFFHEDVWIFKIIGNKVFVEDAYFIERFKPLSDVELGGTDDLKLLGYQIRSDFVVVKINRALNTHDKYDKVIKPGTMDFVWAFGKEYSLFNESAAITDHFKMALVKDDELIRRELEDYHAIINMLAWGLLVDIAIIALRYFRNNKPRFDFRLVHVVIMVPVVVLTLVAISIVIYKNWNQPRLGLFRGDLLVDYHMVMGLILGIYIPLVASAGISTFLGVNIPHIRMIHIYMGYTAYVVTKLNIVTAALFYAGGGWKVPILTYLGLLIMAHRSLSIATTPRIEIEKKREKIM